MLDLSGDELRAVRVILAAHWSGREVRAFGSRAADRAKPHSDLDLVAMGGEPLADLTRAELLADFDDSDLPFRVDILAWRDAPPSLREAIKRDGVSVVAGGAGKP